MGETSVLTTLVFILAAALFVVAVSQKLKILAVVGFMLTGVFLGPSGIGLVKSDETISLLADVGVMMLLFVIGLDFSLRAVTAARRSFFLGGGLQVGLTAGIVTAIFIALGFRPGEAVIVGFIAANSATAVLAKILADRGEMDSPHGQSVLAITLFNDLIAVPVIALIPLLAGRTAGSTGVIAKFGWSLAAITAVFFLFRAAVPRLLEGIVRTRIRELFVLSSLLLCLGMALISGALGLSMAFGAFLAGLIVADSPYSFQMAADILPLKDVFISLFFISIGLLLDIRIFSRAMGIAVAMAAGVLILKTLINLVVLKILKLSPRGAVLGALGLAQIGEFAFVLAGAARAHGFLAGRGFQLFLSSAILTMIVSPYLLRAADALSAGAARKALRRADGAAEEKESPAAGMNGHVIIVGYGLNGQNLARVLRTAGIEHLVIDLNPKLIRQAVEDGEKTLFGDVCRTEILRLAGIRRAKIIVFAISDATATRRGLLLVRGLGSKAQIIVRSRYVTGLDALYEAGADSVIPEEFETSIEVFSQVLEAYHIPKNIIDAEVKAVRAERYGILRATGPVRPSFEKIADLLTAGTAETFYVSPDCPAAGRTLAQLDLRARTGATVIAVVRGEESHTGPAADFLVEPGDTLVLVADHAAMDVAFDYLAARAAREADVPPAGSFPPRS